MNHDEYEAFWSSIDFEPDRLDEPARTLARHVLALMDRVDRLPAPEVHDEAHGRDCRCGATQCACAYDHPDAVCRVHAPATGGIISEPLPAPWAVAQHPKFHRGGLIPGTPEAMPIDADECIIRASDARAGTPVCCRISHAGRPCRTGTQ